VKNRKNQIVRLNIGRTQLGAVKSRGLNRRIERRWEMTKLAEERFLGKSGQRGDTGHNWREKMVTATPVWAR